MIGLGINLWAQQVTGALGAAPVAPTLALTSGTSDNTPDFVLTGDLAVNDVVRFQYSTAANFLGASEITNTIDAGADAANQLNFSTGILADGTWFFRARIERPGHIASGWSNTASETIAAVVPAAWNPADAGASFTISGVTATYTANTFGTHNSVRSTTSHATGKYYIEFTVQVGSSGTPGVGIGDAGFAINPGSVGDNFFGIGYYNSATVLKNNGTNVAVGTMPTFTTGDVIGMAVDLTSSPKKVYWRVNGGSWEGTGTDNPVTGVGGYDITALTGPFFLAFSGQSQFAGGDRAVINPAPASPPSGYGNW